MNSIAPMRGSNRHSIALWVVVALAWATTPVQAQVRNETLVSDQPDLIDSEFSQSRAMITWSDAAGGLWIADIDRETGLFVPSDGKGLLIDPSAMRIEDIQVLGNGPEWISTAEGDQIVYSKFRPDVPHTTQNARLAFAQQLGDGSWSYGYRSPFLRRNGPYASHDPGDPLPRISYIDPYGNHYWRDVNDPSSETLISTFPRSRLSARFVEGARAIVFTAPVAGVSQLFFHWLDTNVTTQVTFDDGQKDLHSVPWSWQAPEFGGDFVISTVVDETQLRIYRQDGGQGEDGDGPGWSLLLSVQTPQQGIINSPEPFRHNGRSYMTFSAAMPPHTAPTAVFMASINPAEPRVVQLTPDWPPRVRRDPEVFVTNEGPYVYFNRLFLSGDRYCIPCNEGVFRTYTGLRPATE